MSDKAVERRRNPRPRPFPPAFNLRLDRLVNPIVRGLPQPYRGMLWLMLLFAASVVWVVWSLEVRMEPIHLHVNTVQQEIRLTDEIARLRGETSGPRRRELERALGEAREKILPDYRSLASWLHEHSTRANSDGLRFAYQFADSLHPGETEEVVRVPIAFEIKINVQSAANDGYRRLLGYLSVMEADHWRKELTMAALESEGGEVRTLKLHYDIWMLSEGAGLAPAEEHDPMNEDEGAVDIAGL